MRTNIGRIGRLLLAALAILGSAGCATGPSLARWQKLGDRIQTGITREHAEKVLPPLPAPIITRTYRGDNGIVAENVFWVDNFTKVSILYTPARYSKTVTGELLSLPDPRDIVAAAPVVVAEQRVKDLAGVMDAEGGGKRKGGAK